MLRFKFIVLIVVLLLKAPNSLASNEMENGMAFITGTVVKIELLKELSGIDANDKITIANLYKVQLGEISVINGVFDGNTISLTITATHKSSIGSAMGEIYAVIKRNEKDSLDTLYWGVPNRVACIPKEKLKELGFAENNEDMHPIARSLCEVY